MTTCYSKPLNREIPSKSERRNGVGTRNDDSNDDQQSINLLDDDDDNEKNVHAFNDIDDDDDDDETVIPSSHVWYRASSATKNLSNIAGGVLGGTGPSASHSASASVKHSVKQNQLKQSTQTRPSDPSTQKLSRCEVHSSHLDETTSTSPTTARTTAIGRALPPLESPTTLTLNSLSQDMDDLRYNPRNVDNSSRIPRLSTVDPIQPATKKRKTPPGGVGQTSDKAKASNNHSRMPPPKHRSSSLPSVTERSTTAVVPASKKTIAQPSSSSSSSINEEWNNASLPSDYQNDWTIVPIDIPACHTKEKLGIVISSGIFPGSMKIHNSGSGRTDNGGTGQPPSLPQQQKPHCVIRRLVANALGERYGMQVGDWFLQLNMVEQNNDDDDDSNWMNQNVSNDGGDQSKDDDTISSKRLLLASVANVQSWSSMTPYRKIYLLRKKMRGTHGDVADQDNTDGNRQPSELVSRPKSVPVPAIPNTAVNDASAKRTNLDQPVATTNVQCIPLNSKTGNKQSPHKDGGIQKEDNTGIVPFCLRCTFEAKGKTTKLPRLHHPWCPKNNCYDNSGADDIMERIADGRRLGCTACEQEYQTGKAIADKKKHSSACLQNQRRLEEERDRLEKEEEELEVRRKKQEAERKRKDRAKKKTNSTKPRPASTKGVNRKQSGNKRTKKNDGEKSERQKKIRQQMEISSPSPSSSSSSLSSEDEDEDTSIYQPRKKKSRIQTLTVGRPSSSTVRMAPKKTVDKPSSTKKRKTGPEKDNAPKRTPPQTSRVTPQHPSNNNNYDCTNLRAPTGDIVNNNGHVKPNWVSVFDNPWGIMGYLTGDVLLYGPQKGVGHYETQTPSRRYTTNPFGNGSNYRRTHCTPEEGLQVVLMKRDPLGKTPWGFGVTRDEFGKACIVQSVDRGSPASAARLLGMPLEDGIGVLSTKDGLDINDILLMINGKQIGGMTEIGLQIELETSGSTMNLVVSRYKHRNDAAKKFAAMEHEMLKLMDSAARDSRLMGWLEIGNGVAAGASHDTDSDGAANGCNDEEDSDLTLQHSTEPPRSVQDNENNSGGDGLPQYRSLSAQNPSRRVLDPSNSLSVNRLETTESNDDFNVSGEGKELSRNKSHGCQRERDMTKQSADCRVEEFENSCSQQQSTPDDGLSSTIELISPRSKSALANSGSTGWNEDLENDQNAWLGCVCGQIHSSQDRRSARMFWIQCENCHAWYDVSEKCIGFTEVQAKALTSWTCEACEPVQDDEDSNVCRDARQIPAGSDAEQDCSPARGDNEPSQVSDHLLSPTMLAAQSLVQIRDSSPKQNRDDEDKSLMETVKPKQLMIPDDVPPSSEEDGHKKNTTRQSDDSDLLLSHPITTPNDGAFVHSAKPIQSALTPNDKCGLRSPAIRGRFESNDCVRDSPKTVPDALITVATKNKMERERSKPLGLKRTSAQNIRTRRRAKQIEVRNPSDQSVAGHIFQVGDLVNVESHSWPGQNVAGGVGHIVDVRVDEDGDRLYSVKSVVARYTDHEILERFLQLHSFE